jgi:pimeloyl-ACP methyl ester carboxylesterase
VTAYKLVAPAADAQVDHVPLVVCLHDLTNSSYMWKDLATLLIDARSGPPARVLVMDFYGHGRSPYSDGLYCTLELFVNQVLELLRDTGLLEDKVPFMLLGQGMGASVALGFAAKYPSMVKSVCLLSPLGVKWSKREKIPPHRDNPLQTHLLALPIFGCWLWRRRMRHGLADAFPSYVFSDTDGASAHYHLVQLEREMMQWQMEHTPGYLRGLESTLLNFPFDTGALTGVCSALGQHPTRAVCVLWGERDNLCGVAEGGLETMRKSFSQAGRFISIDAAGHFPLVENFEAAADAILVFVGECSRSLRQDLMHY